MLRLVVWLVTSVQFKELPEADVRFAARFRLVFSVTTKSKRGARWIAHSSGPLEDAHKETRRIAPDHFEVAIFDFRGVMYWSTRYDIFNNTLNASLVEELLSAVHSSPDGERYFDLATGYELIEASRSGDVAIVGIDGFQLLAEGLLPKMELIADFSALSAAPWAEFQEQGSRAAKAFLDSIEDRAVIVNFTFLRRAAAERNRTTR